MNLQTMDLQTKCLKERYFELRQQQAELTEEYESTFNSPEDDAMRLLVGVAPTHNVKGAGTAGGNMTVCVDVHSSNVHCDVRDIRSRKRTCCLACRQVHDTCRPTGSVPRNHGEVSNSRLGVLKDSTDRTIWEECFEQKGTA